MKLNKLIFLLGALVVFISSGTQAMGFGKTAGQFLWRHKGAATGLVLLSVGSVEGYGEELAKQQKIAAETKSDELDVPEAWQMKAKKLFAEAGMNLAFKNYTDGPQDVFNMGVARYGNHAILYLNRTAQKTLSSGPSGYQPLFKIPESHLTEATPPGIQLIKLNEKTVYIIAEEPYTGENAWVTLLHEYGHAINRDHETQIALERLTIPAHAMIGVAAYKRVMHLTRALSGLKKIGALTAATSISLAAFMGTAIIRELFATIYRELKADKIVFDTEDANLIRSHIDGFKKDASILQAQHHYGLSSTGEMIRIPPISLRIALAERALKKLQEANGQTKE